MDGGGGGEAMKKKKRNKASNGGTFCSNDPLYRQASGDLRQKRSLSFVLLDYECCRGLLLNFRLFAADRSHFIIIIIIYYYFLPLIAKQTYLGAVSSNKPCRPALAFRRPLNAKVFNAARLSDDSASSEKKIYRVV